MLMCWEHSQEWLCHQSKERVLRGVPREAKYRRDDERGRELAGGPAAVDEEGVGGDERGGGGGEEDDGTGNVHGHADTVKAGDALEDVGTEGGVGESGVGTGRGDECGRDCVYNDVVFSPHQDEASTQLRDP